MSAQLITCENAGKFFDLTLRKVDGLYIISGECLSMTRHVHVEQAGRAMGTCVIGSDWWDYVYGYTDEHLWAELHQYEMCHIKVIEHIAGKVVEHKVDVGIAVPTTESAIDYIAHHEYVRGDFTLIFADEEFKEKMFSKENVIDELKEDDNE